MGNGGIFVDDENAEFLRLNELAARVGASDDDVGLFRNTTRDFGSNAFEQGR